MNIIARVGRWFNQVVMTTLTMRHPRGTSGWGLLNRTSINYAREVTPEANSIIIACVRWVQRTFSEAPMMLQEWLEESGEWEDIHRHEFLDLLERPNPHYNGTTLAKAMVADYMLNGNAYWIKVRSRSGRVVQYWWAPSSMMEPRGNDRDASIFIDHYRYTPNASPISLRVEDVIHFRDGIDPSNPRQGLSPIKSLFREIFTDDEAANMTAALLRNMGIPGVIIAPKSGTIQRDAADRIKELFQEKTTGDRRGEAMVMQGDVTVTQLGFSPEQMQLRGLRGVPEERITAVLGVNAAVVGLGAGLATTKVGATLREYREEAFESTICPMYREMASELTHQALGDAMDTRRFRLVHDLAKVRVLQEDELNRAQRWNSMLLSGGILISEYRRALGLPVKPEHELYLRPVNVRQIPTGPLRVQEGNGRLESALLARLKEPDVDVAAVLEAYNLVTKEEQGSGVG